MNRRSTSVEVAFAEDGEIRPRRFRWQGHSLEVEGIGRRWAEGGRRCFNVVAMGGCLFELCLDPETLRWSVTRIDS